MASKVIWSYEATTDLEILAEYIARDSVFYSGKTFSGEPVHSVWAYNKNTGWAVLITVYRPDPEIWIDCRERRK